MVDVPCLRGIGYAFIRSSRPSNLLSKGSVLNERSPLGRARHPAGRDRSDLPALLLPHEPAQERRGRPACRRLASPLRLRAMRVARSLFFVPERAAALATKRHANSPSTRCRVREVATGACFDLTALVFTSVWAVGMEVQGLLPERHLVLDVSLHEGECASRAGSGVADAARPGTVRLVAFILPRALASRSAVRHSGRAKYTAPSPRTRMAISLR